MTGILIVVFLVVPFSVWGGMLLERRYPARTDPRLDKLRAAAWQMLDAEEAHRRAPTIENQSLLFRARGKTEDALTGRCSAAGGPADQPEATTS